MTATNALILAIVFLVLAAASLVYCCKGLLGRVSEQLQTPVGGTRPEAIDMTRLRARMAELRHEFGQDVALLMFGAAIEDLDRHLAVLQDNAAPDDTETAGQQQKRSLHSIVGIASTLGCTDLAERSRALDKLDDATVESPAALQELIDDIQELRAKLATLQAENPPGAPAAS
ncbi:Hpt domain-containing protein [Paracoccus sp. R86501]|uniref:Hpt domain-containing protein n=1 Tax=Paracoccus sp. R86501 TaxID=3101711 RepID=UPI00366E0E47